ncbi:MAG: PAS domain S-box protein [Deltaproteobacteria bacterium]|nr:PAS domain S-box protein [Deltaproteobacteria bacterium]
MLFVTQDSTLVGQVNDLIKGMGLTLQTPAEGFNVDELLDAEPPEIALVDTSIGTGEAKRICVDLRAKAGTDALAILVVVDEMEDEPLSDLLACGVDGLLSRSLKPLSFKARISAHLARIITGRTLALRVHDSEVLIDITSRLVGSADILDSLYDVAALIADELMVDRCSVVLVRPQRDFGLVVASSDNPDLRSLAINLKRYPEIASVVDNGKPLIIDDIASSTLLEQVLPSLKGAGVASVALFPITRMDEALGVIFLRFIEKRSAFEEREIVFCQTVANAASIALRNAEILELLKAKTREVEKVQTEVRDRLRILKRYEDFFIGALDGMVVLEQTGKIVFVNPMAAGMMAADAPSLVDRPFAELIVQEEKQEFDRLLDEFVRGEARRSVDFHLLQAANTGSVVSISAGSLFGEEGMMLLTMRDVTDERAMERRLIDAQQRLVQGEKQAAMAQLAGTAAHELNQPLTSVMTSLALLRRIIASDDASQHKIITTLEQESERMASIIRRLTKITNYTLKDYVGEAKIIDLDTACADEPSKMDHWLVNTPESDKGVDQKDLSAQRPSQDPPTGMQLLEAFIFLSRKLNLAMQEDELIQLFVHTYEDLLPGRLLCIRLLDPKTMALNQVYANGRLREDRRGTLQLTHKACVEHQLDDETTTDLFAKSHVVVTEEYEPIFQESAGGFDIPLYDGTAFYGVLNFEHGEKDQPIEKDKPIAIPLAHQMCAALRNARLLAETILLKDYLEKLLDRANAPVLVVDKRRRITVVNQAFERQTGYNRADLLKADLLSLISESERSRMLPVVLAAMRGESISNFEVRIPHAEGKKETHIAFNTGVVLSAFGELEGVIFVGQDLTEIRALQNQVIHSEKLATLGQVAAGVAHELNNPLTSITIYASYLVKQLDNQIEETDLAKLRRIVDAAGRIQAFTRDLVTYARPSGEEPTLIRVSVLLERALSFCEHLVEESRADVILDVADNLQPIYGIRGQLEQVFVNLLTNACHALPDAGGIIRIAARAMDEERIEITVRDSGHGMSEDRLSEIFEPFYTTKPEGQGTGLGLSIVRNILVNHNSEIKVQSEVGKETTFTLTMYSQ